MAYSIDEIIRLMNETAKLHLKKVSISEDGQRIVINGQDTMVVTAAEQTAIIPTVLSEPETEAEKGTSGTIVSSPMVGVFYASPGPEAEPFVQVGDTVHKGQVLCIVEAMKLMNEIESEYNGRITRILAQNESMVEYGQPLFEVEVQDGTEY